MLAINEPAMVTARHPNFIVNALAIGPKRSDNQRYNNNNDEDGYYEHYDH